MGGLVAGGELAGAPLADRLIGGAIGFGALALVAWGYRQLRSREGLGGGDPKLLGAIGLWTGWAALAPILVVASLSGLVLAVLRRHGPRDAVAFGTLLALGGWLWSALALLQP